MFADVTSANVVGYQNKGLNPLKKAYICQTMQTIGKTVAKQTLADWSVSPDFEFDNDFIMFWTEDGDMAGKYTYVPQEIIDDPEMEIPAGTKPGWFDFAAVDIDWDFSANLNNTEVPMGTMAMVFTANNDATVNFAGEVRNDVTPLTLVPLKKTYIGNCSPVDITLGDIEASEEFEFDNDYHVLDGRW